MGEATPGPGGFVTGELRFAELLRCNPRGHNAIKENEIAANAKVYSFGDVPLLMRVDPCVRMQCAEVRCI